MLPPMTRRVAASVNGHSTRQRRTVRQVPEGNTLALTLQVDYEVHSLAWMMTIMASSSMGQLVTVWNISGWFGEWCPLQPVSCWLPMCYERQAKASLANAAQTPAG